MTFSACPEYFFLLKPFSGHPDFEVYTIEIMGEHIIKYYLKNKRRGGLLQPYSKLSISGHSVFDWYMYKKRRKRSTFCFYIQNDKELL